MKQRADRRQSRVKPEAAADFCDASSAKNERVRISATAQAGFSQLRPFTVAGPLLQVAGVRREIRTASKDERLTRDGFPENVSPLGWHISVLLFSALARAKLCAAELGRGYAFLHPWSIRPAASRVACWFRSLCRYRLFTLSLTLRPWGIAPPSSRHSHAASYFGGYQ